MLFNDSCEAPEMSSSLANDLVFMGKVIYQWFPVSLLKIWNFGNVSVIMGMLSSVQLVISIEMGFSLVDSLFQARSTVLTIQVSLFQDFLLALTVLCLCAAPLCLASPTVSFTCSETGYFPTGKTKPNHEILYET